MSALILPRRFLAQPWNTLEVDWSHPAFTGRRAIVIVGGVPFSRGLGEPDFLVEAPTGSARVDASAKGLAWHGTGSGTRVNLARSLGTQTSALVILGSGVIRSARAADNYYFGYCSIGAGSCQFGTGGSPSAGSRRSWSWVGGYAACVVPHATSMSTAPMVYVDGARCVPTDSGGTGTTINWGSASDVRYNVGYDPGNPTFSQNDRVVLAVFFSGALSDALAKSLSENPRQLFKPRRQVLYFDVGGGTGATPSAADAGTLTLTGSAANGVRALAGVAASGSITLTGSAANAVRALAGVAASGSITLTGSNAAALRTWLGVAGAGSITLTGSDAVGVKAGSGAYNSTADAGSITLSGSAAVGTYDRLAAAGSGSITLTGSDASGIRNIPATAESGSIVLTGSAAVGIRTWLAAAEAGNITLSGSDAEGVYGGAMTLTPADLDAIAAAVWADPSAVAAHAKLDAIIARITC